MKKNINFIKLNVKKPSLDAMVTAYSSGYAPTRQSVALACGVSEVTSGKVANALIKSGIMCEKQYSVSGERPAFHLFFDDSVRVMLIDISSSVYSMGIFDAYGQCAFRETYNYDFELNFNDNFTVFLSRSGLKAKRSGHAVSAICVMYSDVGQGSNPAYLNTQFYRANSSDKERIDGLVYSVFRKHPLCFFGISEAISSAMHLNVSKSSQFDNGTSYLFIGSYLSAMNLSRNRDPIVCNPQKMILPDRIPCEDYFLSHPYSKDAADTLLAHFSLFLECAFNSGTIIVESDLYTFDYISVRRLGKLFAMCGSLPPITLTSNTYPSLSMLGAIRKTLLEIVRKYVVSV